MMYSHPVKPKSNGIEVRRKDCNSEGFMGVLEVLIHQARDIHNICIYHKQDVYAKLCLTTHPEKAVSTQIINGGGQNPVFNENLKLNVGTIDSSFKCEIWMLSRLRNYLEDQLLGFVSVPISEIITRNGKLEKEFSLSSTDLFHSPAGFIQLSLVYTGSSPEVFEIFPSVHDSEKVPESIPCDMEKIEFPDPEIVKEIDMMVSEYIQIPCMEMDSDIENHSSSESLGSPSTSISTNGSAHQDSDFPQNEKKLNIESDSVSTFVKPVLAINVEQEQKVVQQDYVDMYMKSMQQFTESLAKMKLPMDIKNEHTNSDDSSGDEKLKPPQNGGSRVFYGSRAFF